MSDLTTRRFFFTQTRCTEAARIPLHLTTIVACLLLTIMPLLSGCGGDDGETGSAPSAQPAGATASLAWSPIQDPSVIAYFVHYGRHSPGQPGSCAYEHSMHAASHSATITNLEPNTTYYFAVSAYNGLESPCSSEASTVTDSIPV